VVNKAGTGGESLFRKICIKRRGVPGKKRRRYIKLEREESTLRRRDTEGKGRQVQTAKISKEKRRGDLKKRTQQKNGKKGIEPKRISMGRVAIATPNLTRLPGL